jgi:ABC-type arginine/histidine transport system permease subunit
MIPRTLIFLILFPLLSTLPILLLAASTVGFTASLALVPAGLILAYSSARLAALASSSSQRILAITFWIFVYIFLAVAPFLLYRNRWADRI